MVAATGVILAALYLLWAYQRVFHGEPDDDNRSFPELKLKEAAVLLPFIGIIVFTGVYPKPMLDRIEPSVQKLLEHVEAHSDFVAPQPTQLEPTQGDGHSEDGASEEGSAEEGAQP
jgi:NADH-quinone oxidoreductase subunit M